MWKFRRILLYTYTTIHNKAPRLNAPPLCRPLHNPLRILEARHRPASRRLRLACTLGHPRRSRSRIPPSAHPNPGWGWREGLAPLPRARWRTSLMRLLSCCSRARRSARNASIVLGRLAEIEGVLSPSWPRRRATPQESTVEPSARRFRAIASASASSRSILIRFGSDAVCLWDPRWSFSCT